MASITTRDIRTLNFDSFVFKTLHRRRSQRDLLPDEAAKIVLYLENPVATGIWRLSATWIEASGISNDVWADVEKEIDGKDYVQIKSGKRERKISVTSEWKEEIRTRIFGRITFLMNLFQFLAQQATGQPEPDGIAGSNDDDEQLILDMVDSAALASKYADALDYFQANLWHDDFSPTVQADAVTRLRVGGFILLKGPRDGPSMVVISWLREPLQTLLTFLEKLGKVSRTDLLPVFSPEEEAFAPYFDLLGMVQRHLITQEHLQPVVGKALSNFSESNFTDCVSSIGLAAEDVLTQVFETLFREQLTRGLTLGQLVDEIHNRCSHALSRREDPPPDLTSLFGEIKSALEAEPANQRQTLEIVRRLLAQVIDANRHVHMKIDKIGRVERRISVFPEKVSHLITELIRFRNAASHKSRIPIGPYECRRSAYAFVVLYTWWTKERRAIDWTKQPREILLECIHRSASQT